MFRNCYGGELKEESDKSLQEIKKEFPDYDIFVGDILKTNRQMIQYKDLMHNIAFDR